MRVSVHIQFADNDDYVGYGGEYSFGTKGWWWWRRIRSRTRYFGIEIPYAFTLEIFGMPWYDKKVHEDIYDADKDQ